MCDVRNCFNTGNMHKVVHNGNTMYFCDFHHEEEL